MFLRHVLRHGCPLDDDVAHGVRGGVDGPEPLAALVQVVGAEGGGEVVLHGEGRGVERLQNRLDLIEETKCYDFLQNLRDMKTATDLFSLRHSSSLIMLSNE